MCGWGFLLTVEIPQRKSDAYENRTPPIRLCRKGSLSCACGHRPRGVSLFWFIVIFAVGGTALILILSLVHANEVEAGFDRKLKTIPHFNPTLSYKSSMCKNAIAIDVE